MNKRLIVKGLVQGIGFRPFVAEIAEELNIDGCVRNTGGIVTIDLSIEEKSVLDSFKDRLICDVPTGGFISSIEELDIEKLDINADSANIREAAGKDHGFFIEESNEDDKKTLPFIPADIATCDRCKEELLDPKNRRFRHPFISCTVCGPRYSILKALPYDRQNITMDDFDMCPDCKKEYTGKGNIRRHAQTIACPNCGPKLKFSYVKNGEITPSKMDEAIAETLDFIGLGGIVAIKDIGGYHLACDPNNKIAVDGLRRLKGRDHKAFAIMFPSTDEIKKYCYVNKQEEELLESPARPIVLLKKREAGLSFYEGVTKTSNDIGAMLACNPVQILLMEDYGPLIMTSANASGDTLEINDKSMEEFLVEKSTDPELSDLKLAVLSNNREILRPLDDSVMKVVCGRKQFIRRGRGYAPTPIKVDIEGEIFAAGGDLKSSFCYVKDGYAYVSQYLGDLESISCQKAYRSEMAAMEKIFGFTRDKVICDGHPAYFSSRLFENKIQVQHHKAHVAAVIGEHNIKGPVLGFAFDGTGFGDDGSIWGSEIFKVENGVYDRVGHLKTIRLIGGDEGAKNCDTILTGYLHSLGIRRDEGLIGKAIDMSLNTVESSSMGRLFDCVAALLDICHYNSYEGQAPIELENHAARATDFYKLEISSDGDVEKLLKELIEAKDDGVDTKELAKGFILAVSDWIVDNCINMDIDQIVLSGGTFLNRILLENTILKLEERGFSVFTSELLPPGDGNISFGQAILFSQSCDRI